LLEKTHTLDLLPKLLCLLLSKHPLLLSLQYAKPEARRAAFSRDNLTMASAAAEKGTKVSQTSLNTKEKDLSGNPTLGLILMML